MPSREGVEFAPAVRRLVIARCGGRCERCGKVSRLELHHRLYRSRGGLGGPENAAALCGMGNAGGCHGVAHSLVGEREGWSVRSTSGDVAGVAVLTARFGRVLFSADGRVLRADDAPCWSHLGSGAAADCRWCRVRGAEVWNLEDEKGWCE